MIVHGALMELGVTIALVPLALTGTTAETSGRYFSFIVPFFQNHLYLMMVMSGVFGIVRIIGAVGLWRNRMRGLALSVINCVVTMVLMVFMLPAGIVDGFLACTALILMLTSYFGHRRIVEGLATSRR